MVSTLKKWPILYINMLQAVERKTHMRTTFENESLIRVPGVDTKGVHRSRLASDGLLSTNCVKGKKPSRGEIGCALGHRNAWLWVINNLKDDEYAVVLEDDTEPDKSYTTDIQTSVNEQDGLNPNAEVTFLCHSGGFGCSKKTFHQDGRWKTGTGNYGYVINSKGAHRSLQMQFPMRQANDIQWRATDKDQDWMYVVKNPIIKQGSIGRYSQIKDRS